MTPIKIVRVISEEVTAPRNDGTLGNALYAVPFQLSSVPSSLWTENFIKNWDHPPQFTNMHRSGIARVIGDRIILDGTTIEEVKQYHQETLKVTVELTNKEVEDYEKDMHRQDERKRDSEQKHKNKVQDISKEIKFG